MTQKKNKIIDLVVLVVIILISVPVVLVFKVRPLISSIYFFIIPSLYLLIRKPRNIKRVLVGTFLIGTVFGFIYDFLNIYNHSWTESVQQLVFKYKFFSILPIDHIIWFFFWALIIISFYEHFLERENSSKISHNFKYILIFSAVFIGVTLFLFFVSPNKISIKYSYFWLTLPTIIPILLCFLKKPKLLKKIVKVAPYFICLFLAYELTAVYLGQWYFPGFYIGNIELAGLRFPLEELFFWIILSSTVVICLYEFFVDDEK